MTKSNWSSEFVRVKVSVADGSAPNPAFNLLTLPHGHSHLLLDIYIYIYTYVYIFLPSFCNMGRHMQLNGCMCNAAHAPLDRTPTIVGPAVCAHKPRLLCPCGLRSRACVVGAFHIDHKWKYIDIWIWGPHLQARKGSKRAERGRETRKRWK